MVQKRNGEIDLLRFLFAIIILLGHTYHTFGMKNLMPRSGICTEYFFLVTGCLLAKKASIQSRNLTDEEIANNTWQYIMHKIKTFLPYYLVSFVLMILHVLIIRKWTLIQLIKELLQSIPLLTLSFTGYGVRGKLCLWGSWFLSAMIIACFVLYPILLKNYHISTKILFPLLGMLLVQYNYKNYSMITAIMNNKTILVGGLIRAISEIAIGASIYELSVRIKSFAQGKILSYFLTGIKYVSYTVTVLYATRFHNSMTDIDYLLWLIVAVTLSFSGVGFVVKESPFTTYCGKITLPIYIFHMLLVNSAYQTFGADISASGLMLVIVASIAFSIGLMYITDYLMAKYKLYKKVC